MPGFHVGAGLPVAAEAGAGESDGVATRAAVDRVEGVHQPAAAVGVPTDEQVGLGGGLGRQLGQHDAALGVREAGAVDAA